MCVGWFETQPGRAIAKDAALLERVVESMTQQRRTKLPALRGERDQVTREHAACVQKSRRVLDVLGDGDAGRSQLAAEHLGELEVRARELEDRVAALDVAIAAVEATTVSRDEVAQAMALWEPVWDVLVDRERARILALVLERVEYDGTQVALSFYPLGMAHLAAEAATMADGDGESRDEAATMADGGDGEVEEEAAATADADDGEGPDEAEEEVAA